MSKAETEQLRPLLVKGIGAKQVQAIARDAAESTSLYNALIDLIQDENETTRMKSSWALAKATEINPEPGKKHLPLLMKLMQEEKKGGVVREIFKTLYHLEIPLKYEGEFIDISFKMLLTAESDLAVKYYAKLTLTDYVKKFPELRNELIESLKTVADAHSDAWRVQVFKTIAKLEKVKTK